jgi:hypothetical protein
MDHPALWIWTSWKLLKADTCVQQCSLQRHPALISVAGMTDSWSVSGKMRQLFTLVYSEGKNSQTSAEGTFSTLDCGNTVVANHEDICRSMNTSYLPIAALQMMWLKWTWTQEMGGKTDKLCWHLARSITDFCKFAAQKVNTIYPMVALFNLKTPSLKGPWRISRFRGPTRF